jgi:predicted lipoprotein with Yx(FWY)xxD motif
MRAMMLAALLLAIAALAAGCGDSDSDGDQGGAAATKSEEAMKSEKGDAMMEKSGDAMKAEDAAMKSGDAMASGSKGRLIKVVGSEYGRVIADARGEAFYLFDKEDSRRSECYGTCTRAWPPVLTAGKPRAGNGVKAGLLGTTKRKNGKLQVTYAGQPLYYYVDDSPGTILCQNVEEFGGLWLVVKPSGRPVT